MLVEGGSDINIEHPTPLGLAAELDWLEAVHFLI